MNQRDINIFTRSLLLGAVFLMMFLHSYFSASIKPFYIFVIAINISAIYVYAKNPTFLLLFIFCLFYTLSLIPYYFFGVDVSAWKDFNEPQYYNMALRIYACFLIVPLVRDYKKYTGFNKIYKIPKNPKIFGFIIFFLISVLIIVFGQSGSNIFESGGYGKGISSKSTMYEYFIMSFFITYYYSNRKKGQLLALVILGCSYVFKSLIYGGRIEVIQFFLLCFYIAVIDFKFNFGALKIIICCLIFYYINQVFGGIRSNPAPLINGNYSGYLNPFEAYTDPSVTLISSNEGDVFQSSVRLLGLIENDLLNTFQRFKAFVGFIISIVVPSSWLPEEANLATYKKDIYNSGGGGLISVYFYAYLGWLGPFLISAYLFWIYRLTEKYKSIYLKLYYLMIFSTFPRWFAYNPIILFKLCLWIIPVVFISNLMLNKSRPKMMRDEFN